MAHNNFQTASEKKRFTLYLNKLFVFLSHFVCRDIKCDAKTSFNQPNIHAFVVVYLIQQKKILVYAIFYFVILTKYQNTIFFI